jgi:hypothetical protein
MHLLLPLSSKLSVTSNLLFRIRELLEKSFFRIIDINGNGVISKKELSDFNPCLEYKSKKLNNIFSHYGRNADINDLVAEIDPKGSNIIF